MRLSIAFAFFLMGCGSFAASNDLIKPGYVLTFNDEFDGNALDPAKWNNCCIDFKGGAGVVGKDPFAYAPGNVSVASGCLRIACSNEPITCPNTNGGKSTVQYRSGQVQTKNKFSQKYGWWEARIKFPAAQSLLPGFWLMPQADSWSSGTAEVDIMEYHTRWMGRQVSSALWWGGYGDGRRGGALGYSNIENTGDWHVYALNWEPGKLEIHVDGKKTQTHTGPGIPSVDEIVILSMAVATWGKPVIDAQLPSSMLVDYVRVYRRASHEDDTRRKE